MLAVPLVLFIEAERTDTLKVRWRAVLALRPGQPRSRNRSAGPAPDRAGARPADTPKKRRARGRRMAVAVLRTRGLLERIVRLALALLRRVKLERLQLDAMFGFENPAETGFVLRMPFAGACDGRLTGTEHPLPSDVPGVGGTRCVPRDDRVRPLLVVGPMVAFLVSPPVFRAARVAWRTRKSASCVPNARHRHSRWPGD